MDCKRLGEHLEKLNTFKTVADLQSVNRASSRLGLSQPAVSRAIKVLESALECRLLERESRGIRLTSDGKRLYEFANLIARNLEQFNFAKEPTGTEAGPLRIATYDNIACNIFSSFRKRLTSEIPQILISVGGPNSRILGDLIGEKSDCALIAQPRVLAGLEYKKLFVERYGFFATSSLCKRFGLNRKKFLTVDDLKEVPLIAMPSAIAGVSKNVDRLLWEIGLKSLISIDSYQVALQLTCDNWGVGIMPLSTTWQDLQSNKLQELNLKDVPRQFGTHELTLCWNAKRQHPRMTYLDAILAEFFSKLEA